MTGEDEIAAAIRERRAEAARILRGVAESLAALHGQDLTVELARKLSCALDLRQDNGVPEWQRRDKFDAAGIAALVAALPGAQYLARMREEFSAQDYFHRSPATVVRAAIAEITDGKRDISPKVKKADLVVIATELAESTGWLPAELRHPDYELLDPVLTKATGEPRTVGQTLSGRRKQKAKAA
jgi:hypothetical protein